MLTLDVKNDDFIFHGRSMQITQDKNKLLAPYNKTILNYGVILQLLLTGIQKSNVSTE